MDQVLKYSTAASLIAFGLGGMGALFSQGHLRPVVLSGLMTGGTFGAFMLGNKRLDGIVKKLSDQSGLREESVKLTLFVALPFFSNFVGLQVAFHEDVSIISGGRYGMCSAIAFIATPSIYSEALIPHEDSEGSV